MKKTILLSLALLAALSGGEVLGQTAQAIQASPVEIPDLSAYILTPKPADTPRINGARVFGVRPGSEFFYAIAATGVRPMTFSAEGLPKGLKLDPRTGRITGRLAAKGEYEVLLTASNALGSYSRELRIVVGDRIALTPPMGWNSWNCWARDVTQEQVLSSARALVEKGLADHGWSYINIDDGWQGKRGGKYNAIQPNAKFPDMAGLSKQIHDMGLRLGIYSTPWVGTYAAHIGSYSDNPDGENSWIKEGNHDENYRFPKEKKHYWRDREQVWHQGPYSFVEADVKQWNDWGVDYLKYDWHPLDYFHIKEMHDALRGLDRDIVYSLSNSAPFGEAPQLARYADCWRTTGDIRDTWQSVSSIGFSQDRWVAFNSPGHWADPDMLVVGLVGWGPKLHYTRLTADAQYTHISLWSLLAAPLLIGCDLARLDDFTLSLLSNDEVIEVNQDPLGLQAVPVWNEGDRVIYAKHLEDGSIAVGMFNRGWQPVKMHFTLRMLGLRGTQTVRDLWRQKDLKECTDKFETEVAPHGVVLLKVYPGNSREKKTSGRG